LTTIISYSTATETSTQISVNIKSQIMCKTNKNGTWCWPNYTTNTSK